MVLSYKGRHVIDNLFTACTEQVRSPYTEHAASGLYCLSNSTILKPVWLQLGIRLHEPRHDKTNKMSVRPAKTQISLGIRPVWSESSLSAWRKLGSLATHWAHSEDSDQTGRMPSLIWVFAGRTAILLVLSCRGSHVCYLFVCETHFQSYFSNSNCCSTVPLVPLESM